MAKLYKGCVYCEEKDYLCIVQGTKQKVIHDIVQAKVREAHNLHRAKSCVGVVEIHITNPDTGVYEHQKLEDVNYGYNLEDKKQLKAKESKQAKL